MTRIIKFRAWDKESRQMYLPNTNKEFNYGLLQDESFMEAHEVMQFTGLTDKNGKEIYEGDIIYYDDCEQMNDDSGIYEITFMEKEARFTADESSLSLNGYAPTSEVIGNIYENKELLN